MWRLLSIAILFSANAFAGWQLDASQSTLNFMSFKNDHIAEVHTFDVLKGELGGGKVMVEVPLSAVNTMIPIRNERMQKMLFEVVDFPVASFNAAIEDSVMDMPAGTSKITDIPGKLSLHGKQVDAVFSVRVTRTSSNELVVATTKPYVLNVNDFGLKGGIDALQKIAGLKVISYAVPVTFNVVFNTSA
jgi:hypothetical protein